MPQHLVSDKQSFCIPRGDAGCSSGKILSGIDRRPELVSPREPLSSAGVRVHGTDHWGISLLGPAPQLFRITQTLVHCP